MQTQRACNHICIDYDKLPPQVIATWFRQDGQLLISLNEKRSKSELRKAAMNIIIKVNGAMDED